MVLQTKSIELGQAGQAQHPAFGVEGQLENLQRGRELVLRFAREALTKAQAAQAAGNAWEQIHQEERVKVWLSPGPRAWPALLELRAQQGAQRGRPISPKIRADHCLGIAADYLEVTGGSAERDSRWWGLHFLQTAVGIADAGPDLDPAPYRVRLAQAQKDSIDRFEKTKFPRWFIDEVHDGMWNLHVPVEQLYFELAKCGKLGQPIVQRIDTFRSSLTRKRLDLLLQRGTRGRSRRMSCNTGSPAARSHP